MHTTPRHPHAPTTTDRTPTRLGAGVMLTVPALVVLTAASPAFTAGVVTGLVAVAVHGRLR